MIKVLLAAGLFLTYTPPPTSNEWLDTIVCTKKEVIQDILNVAITNNEVDFGKALNEAKNSPECEYVHIDDSDILAALNRFATEGGPDVFYGVVELDSKFLLAVRFSETFWIEKLQEALDEE